MKYLRGLEQSKGVVLAGALILLVSLTLIAVTVAYRTSMNELIAANQRDALNAMAIADSGLEAGFAAVNTEVKANDNELPVVIPELCTACNDCVIACPLDLFELMPMDQKLIVQCKNLLHGDAAEDLCSVACNACMKCVADSEPDVIEIRNNLAVIDYTKNSLTDPKAIARCETGAIVWVEGQQFKEVPAKLETRAV